MNDERLNFEQLEEKMRREALDSIHPGFDIDVTYSDVWYVWNTLSRPVQVRSQPSTPTDLGAALTDDEMEGRRGGSSGSAELTRSPDAMTLTTSAEEIFQSPCERT